MVPNSLRLRYVTAGWDVQYNSRLIVGDSGGGARPDMGSNTLKCI